MSQSVIGGAETALVQRIASDYRAKGYDVTLDPADQELPTLLAGYRPDLIARRGDENVVVEVKSRHRLRQAPQIQQLATAVQKLPGWRFELVVASPEVVFPLPAEASPWDASEIQSALDEARVLLDAGHVGPALLMTWAAAEAALRLLAAREGVQVERSDGNALLGRLSARGVLARQQYKVLRSALEARNALAHGLRSPPLSAARLRHLIDRAGELLLPVAAE